MSNSDSTHTKMMAQRPRRGVSGFVLVVIMVLYTGFAIPVSIVAMSQMFFLGLCLAAFLGYQFVQIPGILLGHGAVDAEISMEEISPQAAETAQETQMRSSGNASFDAYRAELIDRLEREQASFEGFVDRLRAAKDATEFDKFMEDRASQANARRMADNGAETA